MSSGTKSVTIIVGNLGANPELRYMPGGDPVLNLSIQPPKAGKTRKQVRKYQKLNGTDVYFFVTRLRTLQSIWQQAPRSGFRVGIEPVSGMTRMVMTVIQLRSWSMIFNIWIKHLKVKQSLAR